MRIESAIFTLPGFFFVLVALVYGALTGFEELVGFPAILLAAGLAFMIGFYFRRLGKRHGVRPEDDEEAELAADAGEQGVYAPWSWWPLVLAAGAAIAFLALAVGWWLMVPAAIVGTIGLVGWVFEFSRGQHAH